MAETEEEILVYIHSDFYAGAWKVEIVDGEKTNELSGTEKSSAIDIVAATAALSYLYEHCKGRKAKIHTENEQLKKGITKWIKKWLHNGWRTKDNTRVQNKEQWQNLYALYDSENMQWIWVRNKDEKVKSDSDFVAYTKEICNSEKNGTWKVTIVDSEKQMTKLSGTAENSSSKRMALMAAIQALCFIRENSGKKAKVFVEDSYIKDGITQWVFSWKKNGWIKTDGTPVLYKELWQDLDELNHSLNVIWCHGIESKELLSELKKSKRKKAKKINLDSLPFDVAVSTDSKPFIITEDWIRKNTNCCTPTKKQMKAIGETYPLRTGWLEKIIGKEISLEAKEKFEGYRKRK